MLLRCVIFDSGVKYYSLNGAGIAVNVVARFRVRRLGLDCRQ